MARKQCLCRLFVILIVRASLAFRAPEEGEFDCVTDFNPFKFIGQIGRTAHCQTIRADDNITRGSSVGIDATEAADDPGTVRTMTTPSTPSRVATA